MFFALIFFYDYDIVATKSFEYTSYAFRIWDLFDDFISDKYELTLRISMYNPKCIIFYNHIFKNNYYIKYYNYD